MRTPAIGRRLSPLFFALPFLLPWLGCSSSDEGQANECSEVCNCVVAQLGASAKSQCLSECEQALASSDPGAECAARLDANGASSCKSHCPASSGSGGGSGSGGSASGISCSVSSTGCECDVSSNPNSFECSNSSITNGTCCASTGWPESGTCECNEPIAKCGLDSGDSDLGFTCRCDYTAPITDWDIPKTSCPAGAGYCCTFSSSCACYEAGSGSCADIGGIDVPDCNPDIFPAECSSTKLEVSSCSN